MNFSVFIMLLIASKSYNSLKNHPLSSGTAKNAKGIVGSQVFPQRRGRTICGKNILKCPKCISYVDVRVQSCFKKVGKFT